MTTEEIGQLKRDHEALRTQVQEFRDFYGTDRLRDLGAQFDELKKTTRWTAYLQLSVAALTPLLTAFVAFATYQATNHNEQEKARVERSKLAADLYSKALENGTTPVLLNTANLTSTLLTQDTTFAKALNGVLNTLAQRQSEVRAVPVNVAQTTPAADSALRVQQQKRFTQLTQNASLSKQAVGTVAEKLATDAVRTLRRSRRQADSLAAKGYRELLAGKAANAQNYFAKADLAYPGLGNNYELSRYLHAYRAGNRPADGPLRTLLPAQQREVASAVLKKFSFGLPDSVRRRLATQVAQ